MYKTTRYYLVAYIIDVKIFKETIVFAERCTLLETYTIPTQFVMVDFDCLFLEQNYLFNLYV